MASSNKNNEGASARTSTRDFLDTATMQPPSMENMALGFERFFRQAVSGFQSGEEGRFFEPPKVTPAVKRKIAALPQSQQVWFASVGYDREVEGLMLRGSVYLVDKEHGSNGKPLHESDGVSLHLAMTATLREDWDRSVQYHVLLGTIVKACLEPMKDVQAMFPPMGTCRSSFPSQRPKKILFQSGGALEHVTADLAEMGIRELAVAESAIVATVESTWNHSAYNDMDPSTRAFFEEADVNDRDAFRHGVAQSILSRGSLCENPYVSEESVELGGWTPPDNASVVPLEWFCRPPPDNGSYRLTELWGWRTNLERATMSGDVDKLQDIVQSHDLDEVREFCECRILLTKVAEKGLLSSCQALLDHGAVSVEGVQAPDAPAHWRPIQRSAGDSNGSTPLHQAAIEGHSPVVELLLERGASVSATDEMVSMNALMHAVMNGQPDSVRILCQHGSDISYSAPRAGEALDLSEMLAEAGGGPDKVVHRKIREVLREYDPRCSSCRSTGPVKHCPCRMERYCNRDCQQASWKKHKKLHREKVGM